MPAQPSSRVRAARAILLLLAAAAATSAFVIASRDRRSSASSAIRYACPMHAEAMAAAPGDCPICGMALSEIGIRPAKAPSVRDPALRQPGVVDQARRRVFSQEVRAPAWAPGGGVVRGLLYDDDVASLTPREPAVFHRAGGAGGVAVRLAEGAPRTWDASTSTVDFVVESKAAALRAGESGWLELPGKPRPALVVPSTAVLVSPSGPYVLASADGREFSRRPISTGKTLFGLTSVVAGLREQERVIVRNAFFLDAQARLDAEAKSIAAARR